MDPVNYFPASFPEPLSRLLRAAEISIKRLGSLRRQVVLLFDGYLTWTKRTEMRCLLRSMGAVEVLPNRFQYAPSKTFGLSAYFSSSENRLQVRVTTLHR